MYENTTLQKDLKIPESVTLTITADSTLTIPAGMPTGNTLTIADSSNQCILTNNGTINFEVNDKITSKVIYDTNGGTVTPSSEDKKYQDSVGIKTYGILPTPTKTGYTFDGWYTEKSGGIQMNEGTEVMPNAHTLYAHWQVVPTPTPSPSPSPSPIPTSSPTPKPPIPTTGGSSG